METVYLERLERIARNLPITEKLAMEYIDSPEYGRIYFAYAAGKDAKIYSVWAASFRNQHVARVCYPFPSSFTTAMVRQTLVNDAAQFLQLAQQVEDRNRGRFPQA